jgi:hypothetical protein
VPATGEERAMRGQDTRRQLAGDLVVHARGLYRELHRLALHVDQPDDAAADQQDEVASEHLLTPAPGQRVFILAEHEVAGPDDELVPGAIYFCGRSLPGVANYGLVAYIATPGGSPSTRQAISAHLYDAASGTHFSWSESAGVRVGQVTADPRADVTVLSLFPASRVPRPCRVTNTRDAASFSTSASEFDLGATLGGPILRSCQDGELSSLLVPTQSSVCESAHLLFALDLDVLIGDCAGRELDRTAVFEMFNSAGHSDDRVVEPHVLADNSDTYGHVARSIKQAQRTA